jgi:hypothetical protein
MSVLALGNSTWHGSQQYNKRGEERREKDVVGKQILSINLEMDWNLLVVFTRSKLSFQYFGQFYPL